MVKHGGGSVMVWRPFSLVRTGKLVIVKVHSIGWSQIQSNARRKHIVCKKLETGAELHLPAGKQL